MHKPLLVLALAASVVTPALSTEAARPLGKSEERGSSHLELVERGLDINNKAYWGIKGSIVAALVAYGIYAGVSMNKNNNRADKTDTTQSTTGDATQPTSTGQTNPPRAIARRKERPLGRGLPVDISEARSFSDKRYRDRRTFPHLDLLSRADVGEALSLFSRMLDELD